MSSTCRRDDEQRHQADALHDPAGLGEVCLLVHARDEALETLAMVPSPKSSRPVSRRGLRASSSSASRRHRQNRRSRRRRRAAIVARRSSGVTRRVPGAARPRRRRTGTTRRGRDRRGLGADTAQDDRPGAVPGRVEPVGDARDPRWAMTVRTIPSSSTVRLVPVEAALVPCVVDRLPPGVPQREAPVQALRRRDLHDERLVGARAATTR